MQFNINDECRVILTAFGAKVYNNHWADLRLSLPSKYWPKALSEGDEYSETLWQVMAIFGPVLHMGMIKMPFKDNRIEIKRR